MYSTVAAPGARIEAGPGLPLDPARKQAPPRVFELEALPLDLQRVVLGCFLLSASTMPGYPYEVFKLRLLSRRWDELVRTHVATSEPPARWQEFAEVRQQRFVGAGTSSEEAELDCARRALARLVATDFEFHIPRACTEEQRELVMADLAICLADRGERRAWMERAGMQAT